MTCHYIFLRGETYILIVYLYIQHYMFNYSYNIIINRNILFNAIVTRINKYIIIIVLNILLLLSVPVIMPNIKLYIF